MAAVQLWCRVRVLGPDGTVLAAPVLRGRGLPDLAALDAVAWLALLARRLGGDVVLADVSPAMGELLGLAGLPLRTDR